MKTPSPKLYHLQDDGKFPNHSRWPLLIYPAALPTASDDPARTMEQVFRENGWQGTWRNGIYTFPHYHSNTHEVLGVFCGKARVQFGGPHGVTIELRAGDVAILPAGTAHQNLGNSADFGVVGAYPSGAAYDLCHGTEQEHAQAVEHIKLVNRPATDPVFGVHGGLGKYWPD